MILYVNQEAAAKGMHLWIWMLQIYNVGSLTIILHINRTNAPYAIIAVKKVILHVIIVLKHKVIILQDLCSPNINHEHHCITYIRHQDDHQVLMSHPAHIGVTTTISVLLNIGMHPYHLRL